MSLSDVFQQIPVEDKLPHQMEVMLEKKKYPSAILSRTNSTYVPQSGTFYSMSNIPAVQSTNNIITFLFSEDQGYADPASAALHFTMNCRTNVAGQNASYDDLGTAVINRARLLVNSVLVEDIQNSNVLSNVLAYCTVNRDYYSSVLNIEEGAFKFASSAWGDIINGAGQITTQPNSLLAINARQDAAATVVDTNNGTLQAGRDFTINLSHLFGLFRTRSFLPLRSMGMIKLEVYLEQPSICLVAPGIAGGSVASYSLSNVRASMDILQLDGRLLSAFDRMMMSQDENMAFTLAYNTYQCDDANVPSSTSTTLQTANLIYSKATPQLRKCLFVMRLTSNIASLANYSVSSYTSPLVSNLQLKINSTLYPATPMTSASEIYSKLSQCFNQQGNLQGGFLVPYANYVGETVSLVNVVTNYFGGAQDDSNEFIMGIDLEKSRNEYYELDGVNSQLAGGTIQLQFNYINAQGGTSALNCMGMVEFTRYLKIQGGKGVVAI